MNTDWLNDGRKIPDEVMLYIRIMAVYAVRELGQSPEEVIKVFNFNRHCIYDWLRQFDDGGYSALESISAPGAELLVTNELDEWLKQTVLNMTPVDFGYDTNLWTCNILAELLKKEFDVTVSDSTVRLHLNKLGFSSQKPTYQDWDRDDREIEFFLDKKFPSIQKLAKKMDADIGFEDESGIGIMTRYGKTWGLRGETPVIQASMKRGGYNVMSVVTPEGKMRYSIEDENINGEVFIEFMKHLIDNRDRPLILLVDHASFHKSKIVRDFVHQHRTKLRIYFLPKHVPEMNPDEQVWNEIKTDKIGKQPIKDKIDLKKRLHSALASLQKNAQRIISFFQLPDTKYAMQTG
jgi:transposase